MKGRNEIFVTRKQKSEYTHVGFYTKPELMMMLNRIEVRSEKLRIEQNAMLYENNRLNDSQGPHPETKRRALGHLLIELTQLWRTSKQIKNRKDQNMC